MAKEKTNPQRSTRSTKRQPLARQHQSHQINRVPRPIICKHPTTTPAEGSNTNQASPRRSPSL